MKNIITCLLATIGLTTACAQHNYSDTNVQGFAELVADTNVVVLDVRTASEFAEGHLERAINVDYYQSDFVEKAKATLPLDKTIAVYCRSGRRSAGAAGKLGDDGYKLVNLKGGIIAWKEANMPIMIMSAMAVQAQTSPMAKKEMADIRKQYAEAKREMEGLDKLECDGFPPNKTVLSSNYNEAGTGPTKEVITYYHRVAYDEGAEMSFHRPFFITRKFNVAAREFYQEFLYDKAGNLKFFFEKNPDGETRFYYCSDDVYDIINGAMSMDCAFANRLSSELMDAFYIIRNRNWD